MARFPSIPSRPSVLAPEPAQQEWLAALRRHARDVYRSLAAEIGDTDAQAFFRRLRYDHRPPQSGSRDGERDAELLYLYHFGPEDLRGSPRRIAEKLAAESPGQYGASANAIEKTIQRRVRAEHERKRKFQRSEARRFRRKFGVAIEEVPPSLFGGAGTKSPKE